MTYDYTVSEMNMENMGYNRSDLLQWHNEYRTHSHTLFIIDM